MSMQESRLPNTVVHFDVAGPDLEALAGFYGSVLGWEVRPMGPGYGLLSTPDGSPDGALVEAETPSLTVGVAVRDLAATLEVVVAHGGTVLMPATDNGWVVKAQAGDPAGNIVTLIQA